MNFEENPTTEEKHEAGEVEVKSMTEDVPVFAAFNTPPQQSVKRIILTIIPLLILSVSAFLVVRQNAAPVNPALLNKATLPAPWKPDKEARAIWIVRFTMTSPESVRDAVMRAKAAGMTDLVVQVRGRGDAFYDSLWDPRAEELSGQPAKFDPLKLMVQEAHAQGLRVHAWLNTYVVTFFDKLPNLSSHMVYKHPDWLMVPKPLGAQLYGMDPRSPQYIEKLRNYVTANRNVIEGLFASPAHPEVKEHLLKVFLDVVTKYDVDGVHFDYIRYPNTSFDYSRATLDRFRAEIEPTLDAPSRKRLAELAVGNPLIYANTFAGRYADFLRAQVTATQGAVYQAVKARKPSIAVSAAVYSVPQEAWSWRFQDWKTWAQRGTLDIICPMVYTPDTNVFRKQLQAAMEGASGRPLWGGIGSWRQSVPATLDKIKVTREIGTRGFILFSYDSAVQFSNLNPQKDYLERLRDGLALGAR